MVLVDTSVWVMHFRSGNATLEKLLNDGDVMCHPFIIGELACGNLKNRAQILSLLAALPFVIEAEHEELLQFIDNYQLMEKGVGLIDIHLLASSLLSGTSLWTFDKQLARISDHIGIRFKQP